VPLINPMHIIDCEIRPSLGVTVSRAKAEQLAEFKLNAGDVLIGRRGEMGRCAVVRPTDADFLIGTGSMAITPSEVIVTEYLCRLLASPEVVALLEGDAVGSTMVNLNQGILQRLPVALPPLAEQRRIVAKLDTLTAQLTRARAEIDRVAAMAKVMRRKALADCFAVPENLLALGELLTAIESGKNMRCDERPPTRGENGVVKVSAVTWGRFNPAASKTLPSDYLPPEKARINKGDLLISRANTLELVGAPVIVEQQPEALFLSDKILRLEMPAASKPWVLWFLRSPRGREQIELLATGNQLSMRNISQDALRRITIPMPLAEERQNRILALELTFARADRLEAEVARARALLDRLEGAIHTRAFRGELVPQDPSDEPASVLLDRIRAERAAAPKLKRSRRAKEAANA